MRVYVGKKLFCNIILRKKISFNFLYLKEYIVWFSEIIYFYNMNLINIKIIV